MSRTVRDVRKVPNIDITSGQVGSGATATISFANVTDWIWIRCSTGSAGSLDVALDTTDVATAATRFTLAAGTETPRLPLTMTSLGIRGNGDAADYEIVAGLSVTVADQA